MMTWMWKWSDARSIARIFHAKRKIYGLSAAVILLGSVAALAAATYTPPVVKEIVLRNIGAGQTDKSFMLTHISAQAGAELDRAGVSMDVKKLLNTGRFSYVDAKIEESDDGILLIYSFQNKLKLGEPVQVAGAEHFDEEKIREILGVETGDLVDDQVMGVKARSVIAEYRKDFYPDCGVTWNIETTDRERESACVRLMVDEGKRARVTRLRFSGNASIPSKSLRKAAKWPSRWNPIWWFRKHRYDSAEIEKAQFGIRDLYLSRGFLDVEVSPPEMQQDAEGDMAITFPVAEGASYRFGEISLEGVSLSSETELKSLAKKGAGDVASPDAIKATVSAVTDYYGERGYIDTSVKPTLDADKSKGVVDVHLSVAEGSLTSIRNIFIQGNTRTRDKVIRREILVYPGDIFNQTKVGISERRLSNLGYFSRVHSYPQSALLPIEKDLVFEVEEKQTGQFTLGAGFSSIDKVLGFAELSQGNFDLRGWPYFTGAGQKLKLRSQFGSRRKDYELSFVEPWFLDKKLSLGLDLYDSSVNYSDYDIERTGAAISLGKALPGANRINWQYRIEKSAIRDIADTNRYVYVDSPDEEYFFSREEDRIESSLKVTVTHDTRDNAFFPNRGTLANVFGHISGGVLGFDTDIYGFGAQINRYEKLWWRHVLRLRVQSEVIEKYGDTDEVPIVDRFFIGGGRTLRGFDYRDVGPKVIPANPVDGDGTYRPVGGKTRTMATIEYTIPLVAAIRLACFYDIGNVWRDAYHIELSELASSAGVGIRLDIPGFPIRIDRAWAIERDDDLTDEDPWVIWIGYDY